MYTGWIDINLDNVYDLLTTSNILEISWVADKCLEIIKKTITADNCLKIKKSSEAHSYKTLQQYAEMIAVEKFSEVALIDDFLELNIDEVNKLFKCQEIFHHTDEILFCAILRWVNHLPSKRRIHLNNLLAYIHPPRIPEDLVQKSLKLTRHTEFYAKWLSKPNVETEFKIFFLNSIGESPNLHRCCWKTTEEIGLAKFPEKAWNPSVTGQTNALYVQGGIIDHQVSRKSFCYNIYKDKWTPFIPLKLPRVQHSSCILNSSIFAIGGCGNGRRMSCVERLDLTTGRILDIESMLEIRASMATVVHENSIYVMGGESNHGFTTSAERYDPRIGHWEELPNMNHIARSISATVSDCCIYASSIFPTRMQRFEFRMNKWDTIESNQYWFYCKLFVVEKDLFCISEKYLHKFNFIDNKWKKFRSTFRELDTEIPIVMEI